MFTTHLVLRTCGNEGHIMRIADRKVDGKEGEPAGCILRLSACAA
jgi:hypothetical protein